MNTQRQILILSALLATLASASISAGELSGNISLQGRYFNSDGAFPGQQKNGGISLSLQPEYKHKWNNEHSQFTFTPFYRWDNQDKERSHADIRQLDYVTSKGDWEFQVGIGKVYWGVAESQHLVDVINQTDAVEGIDGEDKLGQPMLRMSRISDNGSLDLYVLPYFRERTFAGRKGRFRTPLVVYTDHASYESARKEKHVDYALRWSESVDELDIGVHYFKGTSRDPLFKPKIKNGIAVGLQPHYPLMSQIGIDLQYTGEETIWKFEGIARGYNSGTGLKDYVASVIGFEHSLPLLNDSGLEMTLLGEYHHDSRGEVANAPFQNDLFIGTRLSLNDADSTELLAGAFVDLDNHSKSLRVEASRRIGKGLKLNLEAQGFSDIDSKDPAKIYEKDDYLQIELQKYF